MKVMVALDGSENAYDALRRALELTKPEDSLLLVHTVEEIHPAPVPSPPPPTRLSSSPLGLSLTRPLAAATNQFMDVSGVMDMMEARAKKIMQRAKTMCTAQGRRREVRPAHPPHMRGGGLFDFLFKNETAAAALREKTKLINA